MHRTQIYLTESEIKHLAALSRRSGEKQSALIRRAVDAFITRQQPRQQAMAREAAAGLWRERDDAADLESLRAEWDRHS
jgi:predicted transcriptional regulator